MKKNDGPEKVMILYHAGERALKDSGTLQRWGLAAPFVVLQPSKTTRVGLGFVLVWTRRFQREEGENDRQKGEEGEDEGERRAAAALELLG